MFWSVQVGSVFVCLYLYLCVCIHVLLHAGAPAPAPWFGRRFAQLLGKARGGKTGGGGPVKVPLSVIGLVIETRDRVRIENLKFNRARRHVGESSSTRQLSGISL